VRMSIDNVNKKYLFSRKVGQGAYGSVYIAKSKKQNDQKAIKILLKSKVITN
jgi:serine/threonine protein kinase